MTLDKTPLIHDPDLLAELERLPKTSFADFQIRALQQKQAKRDELKAMPPGRRRREQTADLLTIGNPTPRDLRHIHPILAICGLPYDRQPLERREFERKHFNMALDVSAGSLRGPNGEKVLQPIPSGTRARLVITHLCSEAILQKSPKIEIADSLTGFVRDIGFPDSQDAARNPDALATLGNKAEAARGKASADFVKLATAYRDVFHRGANQSSGTAENMVATSLVPPIPSMLRAAGSKASAAASNMRLPEPLASHFEGAAPFVAGQQAPGKPA